MRRFLSIELHTYWHAGTGRGEGPGADALVARTPGGLPFLPGRTVKGLVRAALEQAVDLNRAGATDADVIRWFGNDPARHVEEVGERVDALEEARYRTKPGSLSFSNAQVGPTDEVEAWEAWAAIPGNEPTRDLLFRDLAATKVDARGMAQDRTLRVTEVTVPLRLTCVLDGPEGEIWPGAIAAALPLIRGLGTGRTRGMGRATFRMEES